MAWKDLSIAQRSQLMNIMRHNGISSLSEMRRLYDLSSTSLSSLEESTFNMQPQAPVYAIGGEKKKKPLFDKEKVANRVPGDAAMPGGTEGVLSATKNYFMNDDDYVDRRLKKAMDISRETKDPELLRTLLIHEDAKRMYLGLPQKYGSFEPSPYKPTIGKSENPQQLNALLSDEEFDNMVLPMWATWKTGKDWPLYQTGNRVKNLGNTAQLYDVPHLQNAGLSIGMDNRGQYLSLYDVWDYNSKIKNKNGDNIAKWVGGKPFDVYNRYYLDEWLDIPEEARGNPYIAPSYVEAERAFKLGGPKKRETAYARKYREEQEAKAKRALEHPTLSNVFRNDVSSETGDKYYDVINARYHQSMDALRRKGFTYEDALRLAPLMVTQNIVEGGWRVARPDDNNFGGLRENGRFLKFDSPEEYYDNYLDLLDRKWGASRGSMNNWRTAQNLDDWSRILNREDLHLWSKERYDAYNREHRDNPVYLYAPEWENSYKSYRKHLAGVEPRVNTYLDMVLEENPYTKEMYNAPIEPVVQQNDGFNLSMDQFQKLLESNKKSFGGRLYGPGGAIGGNNPVVDAYRIARDKYLTNYANNGRMVGYPESVGKAFTYAVSPYLGLDEWDAPERRALFSKYFGLKGTEYDPSEYIEESKYKPSISSDKDAKYYTYKNDVYSNFNTHNGVYKLSIGTDNGRSYISLYDKWDISPFKSIFGLGKGTGNALGGTPIEMYDRIYSDEQPELYNTLMERYKKQNHIDYASGGKIHIKPENRGKFTALKKRTGHSASWFKAHGTPAQRKMATFALNAKHWKHSHGGIKF